MAGGRGEGFKIPVIKNVAIKGEARMGVGDVILVPGAGVNFLGKDLQIQLGIEVIPEEERAVDKLLEIN